MLTATDSNGCSSLAKDTVYIPEELTGTISYIKNETGIGACDGEATVTAWGGTSPFGYRWNDPNYQRTSTATDLCSGTYTVTVLDHYNPDSTGLYFDGNNDRVTVPHNTAYNLGTGDFTFEAWIKAGAGQLYYPIIYSKRQEAYSGFLFYIYADKWSPQGKLGIQLDGTNYARAGDSLLDNNCHHIAAVRLNDIIYYYIEGEFIQASYYGIKDITTNHDLWIGWDQPAPSTTPFKGYIKEARIWNIARTEQDIKKNMYDFLKGDEPGLIGYWRLNDNTGQTVKDYSDINNNGYLGSTTGIDDNDPQWQYTCPVNTLGSCIATAEAFIYIQQQSTGGGNTGGGQNESEEIALTNNEHINNINGINVYPNSSKNLTHITYGLTKPSIVSIEVFTITGVKIQTIINKKQDNGFYEYDFGAKKYGYSSGIYILRVKINNETHNFKLIELGH